MKTITFGPDIDFLHKGLRQDITLAWPANAQTTDTFIGRIVALPDFPKHMGLIVDDHGKVLARIKITDGGTHERH